MSYNIHNLKLAENSLKQEGKLEIVRNSSQNANQTALDAFDAEISAALRSDQSSNTNNSSGVLESISLSESVRPMDETSPFVPLTFAQMNAILARRDFNNADPNNARLVETIISKPDLYQWLVGPNVSGTIPVLNTTGRNNLSYFISNYSNFLYSTRLPGAASPKIFSFERMLDSITTSLWSGLLSTTVGDPPTEEARIRNIAGFIAQIGSITNGPPGENTFASRQRAVGLFAESVARNAVIVEGYDNLPVVGRPSLETIANERLALLANSVSSLRGTAKTFTNFASALVIPILVAGVREAPNRVETINKILAPLTQEQIKQVTDAMSTQEFFNVFSYRPGGTASEPTPGSYEKFVSNLAQSTTKDKRSQVIEAMMLSLDKVPPSSRTQVLGALTDIILQDPTDLLFNLYKEDNVDTSNVGNTSGRALSTYLKYMIEGEKFSDLKAIVSLMTAPPGYEPPLNNDAVYNDDAVLNPDGTVLTPATLKTPATVNSALLNAAQIATLNQTSIFAGRTEYPSVVARGYFIGSFGRALDQLTAKGADTRSLSRTFASTTIDVTKTVVGIFVKGKLEKLSSDFISIGAKLVAPSLFGNPANANELLDGLVSALTPRDPNNINRPLPVSYLIVDSTTDPATSFSPISTISNEAARLRSVTWVD